MATTLRSGVPTAARAPSGAYTATLRFDPSRAQVGAQVEARGGGYPPGATVELVWYTVDGRYELERGTEFVGPAFEERSWVIARVRADAAGEIRTTLDVPLDYGGSHDVRGRVDGRELSQAALTIQPTVTMSPREGPLGTPVELRIVGIDWRPNLGTWQALYDNKHLGFVSALTTRGLATARFRAAGPVGDHVVGAWRGSYNTCAYLAWDTGPFKDMPAGTDLVFRVTEDAGLPSVIVEDFEATDDPWSSLTAGPGSLSAFPDRGRAGERFALQGIKLPRNRELDVRWWTTVGNRVTGVGMTEDAQYRSTVRTDERGAFLLETAFPDDLGGQHKIDLVADGEVLASTGVVILPKVVSIGPTRLRTGEHVEVHLKGIGWTTYDNTYTVTYDNAFIGYVCGFSTGGDVTFRLPAAGGPGTHLIDLYPTIYTAKDRNTMPRGVYSVPQLTYADDHPGRRTPAIRLAIEIVG